MSQSRATCSVRSSVVPAFVLLALLIGGCPREAQPPIGSDLVTPSPSDVASPPNDDDDGAPPDDVAQPPGDDGGVTRPGEDDPSWQLTVTITGRGGVEPADSAYIDGTELELRAVPEDGWRFGEWGGDLDGADPEVQLLMDRDRTVIATFIEQAELTLDVVGAGEVLVEPDRTVFDVGTELALRAVADADWQFVRWEGDLGGDSAEAAYTIDGDATITAVFEPLPVELVLLDGFSVGGGLAVVDPAGVHAPFSGWFYEVGATVRLEAIPDPGWFFVGWGGDIESFDTTLDITMTSDTFVFALFEDLTPPPPPQFFGAVLIAADGTFLGTVNDNPFDVDSLANPFGLYGSAFNSLSIWNRFGPYGSEFSLNSAYNDFTTTPPALFIGGTLWGYVTENQFLVGAIDPDDLAILIGRFDVVR